MLFLLEVKNMKRVLSFALSLVMLEHYRRTGPYGVCRGHLL